MMNKAINTLVLAMVDSITKFKNKLAYYLAIFAMVFGSTFGTMNAANAATLTLVANDTWGDGDGGILAAPTAGDNIVLGDFTAIITQADAGTATISVGAVTGTGDDGTPTLDINFADDAASTDTISIASVVITADADTAGLIDIDFDDGDTGTVSGTLTFTGDVDTGTETTGGAFGDIDIDFADSAVASVAGTINFGGDVTGTVVFDEGAESIILIYNGSAAQTITGTINSNGDDGDGILRVTNITGVTFASAVGKETNGALATIDINGATTFDGASESAAYTVDADTTFTGAVTANTSFAVATANTDVILSSASSTGATSVAALTTLTASKALTAGDTAIATTAKLFLDENANAINDIQLVGTAELHIGKAVNSGETLNAGATADGAGSFPSTAKVYLPANLADSDTLLLTDVGGFDAGGGTEATTAVALSAILQDTAIVNYTAAATNGTTITITATNKSVGTISSELGVTDNMSKALLEVQSATEASNADSSDVDAYTALYNSLNALGGQTATADTALSKQVAPQDDMIAGSTFAAKAMTGSLQGIMSNRMASLRSGDAFMTGMSAGNGMSANSGFIQAFGTEAEQKNKTVGSGTQFGYDASSAGLALGFDGITDNGSVVGLSFSMSNTDVDGKGTGKSKNDIDSYTVSVYADKTTDAGYIEGSLTVGLNENNSSRIVNTAGLDRTYKGDYDSEQVSLKIGGGMPNAVGTGFVTPYGSVTATRITTDAYTETSTTASDALRLRVAQDDVDSIVGTVGLKYHTVLDNGGTPMISLAINNEFGDNTINSSNTYQGGGTAFTTSTDVEELSATLGLGYSFRSDNTTLELAYEADANDDDYLGHYGSIKIVSKF